MHPWDRYSRPQAPYVPPGAETPHRHVKSKAHFRGRFPSTKPPDEPEQLEGGRRDFKRFDGRTFLLVAVALVLLVLALYVSAQLPAV